MTEQDQQQNIQQILLPEIHRARFDKLTIYEISETELETLERGSPDSIYLNFAIFLLSVAVSFTVTLCTTPIASIKIFIAFFTSTIVGYIVGLLLLVMWFRSYKSVSNVVKTIRKRLPPEGEAQLPPIQTELPEQSSVKNNMRET